MTLEKGKMFTLMDGWLAQIMNKEPGEAGLVSGVVQVEFNVGHVEFPVPGSSQVRDVGTMKSTEI